MTCAAPRAGRLHERAGIELRQVDPSRRRFRRYHMSRCTSLFGEPALLIAWGRIGRIPRVRVEIFGDSAARTERWNALLERRDQHGYEIIQVPMFTVC